MRRLRQGLLLLTLLSQTVGADTPAHWELSSNIPEAFSGALDRQVFYSGRASGHLQSLSPVRTRDYAVLSQRVRATSFRGRRLRMSGYLKTENASGWVGMWLRVDGVKGPPLAFDNMQDRPILGSTPWKRYEIELDVPAQASELHFGLLLAGPGKAWIDQVRLESIGPVLPGAAQRARLRGEGPENLDFESGL